MPRRGQAMTANYLLRLIRAFQLANICLMNSVVSFPCIYLKPMRAHFTPARRAMAKLPIGRQALARV